MNPFEMVAIIVIAVMIGGVLRARYHSAGTKVSVANDPEAIRMREEIKTLRDRVAVLERIATDKEIGLEREIDRLRDS
jgi:hypothetical protein